MSETREISFWAVRIDANYMVQGQVFELCMKETSSISRVTSQVAQRFNYAENSVRIWKINTAVLPPADEADGLEESQSLSAMAFDTFLKELRNNPKLVQPLRNTAKVSKHFEDDEDVLQAIALIDGEVPLLSAIS